MSMSLCTRCLNRLQLQVHPSQLLVGAAVSSIQSTAFHTSSSRHVVGGRGKIVYRNLTPKVSSSKTRKREKQRPPPPGERQQQRKRIVLSNTNAPEVKGLQPLTLQNCADQNVAGRILSFDDATIDRLRASKAFKKTQSWRLFRRPATLMRKESVEIGNLIAREGPKTTTDRIVVAGERISGKSVLLTQASAMALMKEWVLITVPEAQDFVLDHFAYAPAENKADELEDQMYDQNTLACAILGRMAASNNAVLSKLTPTPSMADQLPTEVKGLKTLQAICKAGEEATRSGASILTYILAELTQPNDQYRPPVMITVDGLDHWMTLTKYRNADLNPIHAHQFTFINTFLNLLFSSKPSLASGGIILGARSASNPPSVPAFDLLLRQLTALNEGTKPNDPTFPLPGAYQYLDPKPLNLLDPAANTRIMHLEGLSKTECKMLMEYFVLSGILKEDLTRDNIAEKWAMSGNGNVGQLCALGARARIDPEKQVTYFGTNEGVKMGQGEHKPKSVRAKE